MILADNSESRLRPRQSRQHSKIEGSVRIADKPGTTTIQGPAAFGVTSSGWMERRALRFVVSHLFARRKRMMGHPVQWLEKRGPPAREFTFAGKQFDGKGLRMAGQG